MADFQQQESCACETPTRFDVALRRYLFARERLFNTADDSDENADLLTDAQTEAENCLMREPAADLLQLRIKADIVWGDVHSIPPGDYVVAIFADLVRLTGGAPSAVFHPARWLAWFERRGGMWAVNNDEALLLCPIGADMGEVMQELDKRGGKPAVLDLIRARHAEREA